MKYEKISKQKKEKYINRDKQTLKVKKNTHFSSCCSFYTCGPISYRTPSAKHITMLVLAHAGPRGAVTGIQGCGRMIQRAEFSALGASLAGGTN